MRLFPLAVVATWFMVLGALSANSFVYAQDEPAPEVEEVIDEVVEDVVPEDIADVAEDAPAEDAEPVSDDVVTDEPADEPTQEAEPVEDEFIDDESTEPAESEPVEEIVADEPVAEPVAESVDEPIVDEPSEQELAEDAEVIKKSGVKPLSGQEAIGTIDTINLHGSGGNWLVKRVWWEKSQTLYGEIEKLLTSILDSRVVFLNERTRMDQEVFDPFYQYTGLTNGELQAVTSMLLAHLQKEREHEGVLDTAEREFIQRLKGKRGSLEHLMRDVESIEKLDHSIDDALKKLVEQINLAHRYGTQAWENIQKITSELDDKKARDLYYGIVTFRDNIANIEKYITNEFSQHFDKTLQSAQEHIDRVRGSFDELKQEGVDLKAQADQLDTVDRDDEMRQFEGQKQEAVKRAIKETKEDMSIWRQILRFLGWAFSPVLNALNYLLRIPMAIYNKVIEIFIMPVVSWVLYFLGFGATQEKGENEVPVPMVGQPDDAAMLAPEPPVPSMP